MTKNGLVQRGHPQSPMNAADSTAPLLDCPACGAALRAQSRFCDTCGHNLAAPVRVPPPAAPVALAAVTPASAYRARRPMGLVSRLVRLAVICGVLGALSFITIPATLPRAITVIALSAISGFSALCLFALVVVRGIRGRRRRSWAVAAVVVVAIEVLLVDGLNVYADSNAASATALVQDSYAEVAAAVSLGDAIQQGRAPAGVTFGNVQTQASAASSRLTALDVPGQLGDYTSSVKTWADDVVAAAIKAQTGSPWQDVPSTPSPFQVDMTGDQASAAFATSLQQVAVLIQFGDRAVAVQDLAAMRYVGARLNAQSFWLEGIYTSADPNVVAAQLHFIEPVNNATATSGGVVAGGNRGVRLLASFWRPGIWRAPRRVPTCIRGTCIPRVRGPLGGLWRSMNGAALACAAAGGKFSGGQHNGYCTTPIDQDWSTNRNQLLPMINASGGQPIGGAGAGVGPGVTVPVPPQLQAFRASCQAQGGTTGSPTFVTERMPTTEGGWGCQIGRCWNYLTYSGTVYKGGEPGCPEQGLLPRPFGPVGGIVAQVGGFITELIPTPHPTWDGTYNLQTSNMKCETFGSSTFAAPVRYALERALPSSTLSVDGNAVEGPSGPVPIVSTGPTGHATYVFPIGAIGSLSATYVFARDAAGVAQVSGNYDIGGKSVTSDSVVQVHCVVTFSGTRG